MLKVFFKKKGEQEKENVELIWLDFMTLSVYWDNVL